MADVVMLDTDDSESYFDDRDAGFSEDDSDFDFVEENEPPPPPKAKKAKAAAAAPKGKKKAAPTKKKAAPAKKAGTAGGKKKKGAAAPANKSSKVLADTTNRDDDVDDFTDDDDDFPFVDGSGQKGSKKTIEEIYQKKSQLEHILLRPDTYVGSVVRHSQNMYVLNPSTNRIVERNINFTPGLFKIFDEIVVNAADNKQRDPSMDKLNITIDAESNTISVENNGKTIPVVIHKEHNCYVPSLLLGILLTGSNFDDDEKKTTGGRNGYGAKLANIFSTEFVIECIDTKEKLKFHQVFRSNMSVAGEPTVTEIKSASVLKAGDRTKITFRPDLKRFSMDRLDEDTVALLSKRAYDVAGTMGTSEGKRLTVSLNGNKLPVKNFKDYVGMYDGTNPPVAYEKVGDRWEVGVGRSEGSFQQVSFVNSICTSKGGMHCTYIADKVGNRLAATLKKKNKTGVEIKGNQIKNHLCVFVNCLIENPAFSSQTKEELITKSKQFGSECTLSEKFLKQVEKSDIVDSIMSYVRFKQGEALKRTGGKKKKKITGIAKLDDANFAGSAKSKDCTLIITEGDSAKSLAMSGLSVVGRDYYGVFPLKGKPLNVRDASHQQIMKNEEIKNLVDIMGLKYDVSYDADSVKALRYGHLMIMADQDSDGSHIKGLVINFIHNFWPGLLDVPGFLQQFITPIVKVTKGKRSKTFFTLPEYETWKEANNDGKGYAIKYYKGLGTSTSAEAKEYFGDLSKHEVHFSELSSDVVVVKDSDVEGEDDDTMDFGDVLPDVNKTTSGNDLIEMAFSKSKVEERKTWLNQFEKGTYLDYFEREEGVHYSDFINKELILFSQADNIRSIPHIMDGFKPSQRKVLFSCFKRKLKGEVKVAQLSGYIGEHSAYHHGEASLAGTIINMAQSYCGSNNINLLTPSGQFGTRRMGGKDHASPRYIFTRLERITRTLFHPDDDALLTYLNDDGISIEPEFYMPVIPLVLVNGADGIGTGWSSSIPNYDPRAIIANIRRKIDGEPLEKMDPHYHGFTGEIIAESGKRAGSYIVRGKIERLDDTTLHISELPLKKWTQDYKKFLEDFLTNEKKEIASDIKDFKEHHTDDTVSFTITATKEKIDAFEKGKNGLFGKFKLTGTLSTSNMNLFDQKSRIVKYDMPENILEAFYVLRLDFYARRKALLLENLRREQRMLANKARFVEEVCNGELIVSNRKRTEILAELQERNYELFSKDDKTSSEEDEDDESDEDGASDAELAKGYEYLLGMKIWSLTFEKVRQLREELTEKIQAVEDLESKSPSDIWLTDLDAIEEAIDERDLEMKAAADEERRAQNKSQKSRKKKAAVKSKKKKKKASEWDSDQSSDEDDGVFNSDSDDGFVAKKAPAKKRAAPKKLVAASRPGKKVSAAKTKDPVVSAPVNQFIPEEGLFPTGAAKRSAKDDVVLDLAAESDDSESAAEVEMLTLADRMKQRMHVSPAKLDGKSLLEDAIGGSTKAKGKKRLSPKRPATKAAKKPATAKTKKNAAVKKTATKAPTKKKNRKILSDDSEMEASSSEDEMVAAPVPARSKRGGRAPISYKIDISSDSESESDVNFEDSDDESDFE